MAANGTASIESAVILPSPEAITPTTTRALRPSPTQNGSKRRQSSISQDDINNATSKRPRLSSTAANNTFETLTRRDSNTSDRRKPSIDTTHPDRRRSTTTTNVVEEKKRGQRLFGGLLSTLSQSPSSLNGAQARKRQDIEKRQLERAQKQREVEEEEKRKLLEFRRREQVKWEEESLRIRWDGLRAMAGCLATRSEPKLYYRPWEMLDGQKETIRRQKEEVEGMIEKEDVEFRGRHPEYFAAREKDEKENEDTRLKSTTSQEKDSKAEQRPGNEEPSEISAGNGTATTNHTDDEAKRREGQELAERIPDDDQNDVNIESRDNNSAQPEPVEEEPAKDHEEVMENDEDTVIY